MRFPVTATWIYDFGESLVAGKRRVAARGVGVEDDVAVVTGIQRKRGHPGSPTVSTMASMVARAKSK